MVPVVIRWSWDEWQGATLDLLHRDTGRCGWCGKHLDNDAARHHRMRRRDGGDRLANLVLIHMRCHVYIHGHPNEAKERGFIVPPWADLLTTPLVTQRGAWLLDDEGRKVLVPA